MEITIKNQQKKILLKPSQIKKITQKVLNLEGVDDGFISLVFVTDQKIKSLNKKYLKRSYPTDVLAFDLSSKRKKKKTLEGEVVVSTTTAYKNSKIYKVTPTREVVLCIIHGILHLLGYDDHKPTDIKKMRQKEKDLMKTLEPLI